MAQQYPGLVDDENGPLLPPWYTIGWNWQNRNQQYIAAPVNPYLSLEFPPDQLFVTLQQQYNDVDQNPTSGFLTFWPSDSFTITEGTSSIRVIQRLAGTQTFPSLDAGVGPWAFSMEGTGKIYIYLDQLIVKLFATDNPHMVTDSGTPLTYHVIEHFMGGSEFDITVPGATALYSPLYGQIVPGSQKPWKYDPLVPMGTPGLETCFPQGADEQGSWVSQSHLSTDFVQALVQATADPTGDTVQMAFPKKGIAPVDSDWQDAAWVQAGYPYVCQVKVGPNGGAVTLEPGLYDIWVSITTASENPVFQSGVLQIT